MALDPSKYTTSPFSGADKTTAKLVAQSVKQQMVTNALLSDLVNLQSKQLILQQKTFTLTQKQASRRAFAAQEAAIEARSKRIQVKDKVVPKKGGKNFLQDLLGGMMRQVLTPKGLLTVAGLAGLAAAVGALSGSFEDLGDRLRNAGDRVREFSSQLGDFLTPIAGFSMFSMQHAAMGVNAAKSGRYATTGGKVRGAVGRGIVKGAKGTAGLAGRGIKATGNLALDGVEAGLNRVGRTNTGGLANRLDDIAIRQGARARSTTLATGITPKTLKDFVSSAAQNTRGRAADFISSARQGASRGATTIRNLPSNLKNLPGNINQQRKLFMQGITGADDVSVLRTANRPFPNIARGVGDVGMEAGGVFRAGRGIRTGAQNAVSATRQAVSAATPQGVKQFIAASKIGGPQAAMMGVFDDIVKNLKNLKVKTITSLGSALKALPGQFANLGKSLKTFGGSVKSAVANFDLGKAALQVSKVGSRGAQGLARGAAGVVRATPGAAQRAATGLRNLRAPAIGPAPPPGMLGKTGSMLKGGAGAAVRGTGSIVKRIPVLGSLISAGFGAMEANDEEMARLMEENNMTREEVNKGLADGSLQKDKAKIIGRSAGAGAGAGVGTVVGGILGSALGPIGTALGAAAGAWLGENVGKFLGEGFANTFKSFDWGATFGPVMDQFKELGGKIMGALDALAGVFGVGGESGEGGGFIEVLKNIGRIIGVVAKLLMKGIAPVMQGVGWALGKAIDLVTGVIQGIVGIFKGAYGIFKNLINNPIVKRLLPSGFAELVDGLESSMSGDVIGNVSSFVDGLGNQGDATGQGGPSMLGMNRKPTGIGSGGPVLTSGRGWRWGKMHQGIDIGFNGDRGGQKMYLPKNAVVVDKRTWGRGDAGYGNSIYFTTDDGITHLYAHMQRPTGLQIGKQYKKGTLVGRLGSTGNSTAPHLHWETGTVEGDVGRAGSSLKDPRRFGYTLQSPFSSTGMSGSTNVQYENRSGNSVPLLDATAAGLNAAGNLTDRISGSFNSMSGQMMGSESSQDGGFNFAQAMAGLTQTMQSVLGSLPGVASSANGGNAGVTAVGGVTVIQTLSPVSDGGRIFAI